MRKAIDKRLTTLPAKEEPHSRQNVAPRDRETAVFWETTWGHIPNGRGHWSPAKHSQGNPWVVLGEESEVLMAGQGSGLESTTKVPRKGGSMYWMEQTTGLAIRSKHLKAELCF